MLDLAPRNPRALGVALLLASGCAKAPTAEPARPNDPVTTPDDPAAVPSTQAVVDDHAAPDAPLAVSHPGCFMLLPLGQDSPRHAGEQSCDERTVPASTFKVPHALIALDTGVVKDPEAMRKWDGTKYWIEAWHRDHNLRTAIYESVVWFFQQTARSIGRERMQRYLEAFDYGNADVSGQIDEFWLGGGSLQVSATESLRFWEAMVQDQLPLGSQHLPQLRSMLVRPPSSFNGRLVGDQTAPPVDPLMVFSAKTGTGRHGEGSVTWLVGHVACPTQEYVFVSRVIAEEPPNRVSPAVTHGLQALDELGVLRCAEPSATG